jgi:hypothetical protein
MIPTIEEILEQRIKSDEEKKAIESQWTIDELGFNSRASQLQEQRWAIQSLEGENHLQRDKSYRAKNEQIDGIRNFLSDQEDLFRKQITLASLKHSIPTMGNFQRDSHISYRCNSSGSANEEVLYETPLVKVIATYSLTDKPTNKIDYVVGIYAHYRFKDMINRMLGIATQFNEHFPEHDAILKFKSFKTLEDAKVYNDRNKNKIIQEWIPQIEKFNDEVQSASDDLESVFDFRLIGEDTLNGYYSRSQIEKFNDEVQSASDDLESVFDFRLIREDTLNGYYSRSQNYNIESKEKNKMVLFWDDTKFWDGTIQYKEENKGSFIVTLSGWQLFVNPMGVTRSPDAIQLRGIYGTLIYNEFNLPHLSDFMRDISSLADEQEKKEKHIEWIAELAGEADLLEDYLTHVNNPDEVRAEVEEYKRRMVI